MSVDLRITPPPTDAELGRPALDDDGRLVTLHHADDGPRDAPVLLLAGSLGSTLAMWEPQLTPRGPVPRDPRRPPRPRRLPDAAGPVHDARPRRRFRRAARRAWSWQRVAFCGLSLGGMVGMYLGSEHPHRLTSLTLCCTIAHFADKTPWDAADRRRRGGRHGRHRRHRRQPLVHPGLGGGAPGRRHRAADQIAGTPDAGYLGCCRAIARLGPPRAARRGHRADARHRRRGRPLHAGRPARPHARRRHPGRAAGDTPRSAPRHDRERRIRKPADFGDTPGHNFVTTPD